MNIFVTSPDPVRCATALDDRRLIKMVLETAQLLSNVLHFHDADSGPYKVTHFNHPCSVWARDRVNYGWLFRHFVALCAEYTRRFDRQHACERLRERFSEHIRCMMDEQPKSFANCSREKEHPDVFEAYRRTLQAKWLEDKPPHPKWTNADPPEFYRSMAA